MKMTIRTPDGFIEHLRDVEDTGERSIVSDEIIFEGICEHTGAIVRFTFYDCERIDGKE